MEVINTAELRLYGDALAVAYQQRANARISLLQAEQRHDEAKYQLYNEVVAEGTSKTATDREYQAKARLSQHPTTYTLLDWQQKVEQTEADVRATEAKFTALKTIIESDKRTL